MMEHLQQSLQQFLTAAFLAALLQQLMPEGAIKTLGNLLAGLTVLLALLQPLLRLDAADWDGGQALWQTQIEIETEQYRRQQKNQWQQLIEENLAAYIEDKAAQLGRCCSAAVFTRLNSEGIPCPVSVTLRGEKDPQLVSLISQQLGIGEEQQVWLES